MKLPAPPAREETENVLPLINVVFLLLIFFMISSVLVRPELFTVAPPEASAEADVSDSEALLLLAADGRLAAGDELIPLEQLGAWFALQIREVGDARKIRLTLKADAGADSAKVISIMQTARHAGIPELRLLTIGR